MDPHSAVRKPSNGATHSPTKTHPESDAGSSTSRQSPDQRRRSLKDRPPAMAEGGHAPHVTVGFSGAPSSPYLSAAGVPVLSGSLSNISDSRAPMPFPQPRQNIDFDKTARMAQFLGPVDTQGRPIAPADAVAVSQSQHSHSTQSGVKPYVRIGPQATNVMVGSTPLPVLKPGAAPLQVTESGLPTVSIGAKAAVPPTVTIGQAKDTTTVAASSAAEIRIGGQTLATSAALVTEQPPAAAVCPRPISVAPGTVPPALAAAAGLHVEGTAAPPGLPPTAPGHTHQPYAVNVVMSASSTPSVGVHSPGFPGSFCESPHMQGSFAYLEGSGRAAPPPPLEGLAQRSGSHGPMSASSTPSKGVFAHNPYATEEEPKEPSPQPLQPLDATASRNAAAAGGGGFGSRSSSAAFTPSQGGSFAGPTVQVGVRSGSTAAVPAQPQAVNVVIGDPRAVASAQAAAAAAIAKTRRAAAGRSPSAALELSHVSHDDGRSPSAVSGHDALSRNPSAVHDDTDAALPLPPRSPGLAVGGDAPVAVIGPLPPSAATGDGAEPLPHVHRDDHASLSSSVTKSPGKGLPAAAPIVSVVGKPSIIATVGRRAGSAVSSALASTLSPPQPALQRQLSGSGHLALSSAVAETQSPVHVGVALSPHNSPCPSGGIGRVRSPGGSLPTIAIGRGGPGAPSPGSMASSLTPAASSEAPLHAGLSPMAALSATHTTSGPHTSGSGTHATSGPKAEDLEASGLATDSLATRSSHRSAGDDDTSSTKSAAVSIRMPRLTAPQSPNARGAAVDPERASVASQFSEHQRSDTTGGQERTPSERRPRTSGLLAQVTSQAFAASMLSVESDEDTDGHDTADTTGDATEAAAPAEPARVPSPTGATTEATPADGTPADQDPIGLPARRGSSFNVEEEEELSHVLGAADGGVASPVVAARKLSSSSDASADVARPRRLSAVRRFESVPVDSSHEEPKTTDAAPPLQRKTSAFREQMSPPPALGADQLSEPLVEQERAAKGEPEDDRGGLFGSQLGSTEYRPHRQSRSPHHAARSFTGSDTTPMHTPPMAGQRPPPPPYSAMRLPSAEASVSGYASLSTESLDAAPGYGHGPAPIDSHHHGAPRRVANTRADADIAHPIPRLPPVLIEFVDRELVAVLAPTAAELSKRRTLVQRVVDRFELALGQVVPVPFFVRYILYGSVALRTVLPGGDNDVSVFLHLYDESTGRALLPEKSPVAGVSLVPPDVGVFGGATPLSDDGSASGVTASSYSGADFMSKAKEYLPLDQGYEGQGLQLDQLVFAEIRLLKLIYEGYSIDITMDQKGGFTTAAFVHEIDRVVGYEHLFKRTLLLLKAWALYDARILGAQGGHLGTYALTVMLVAVFNQVMPADPTVVLDEAPSPLAMFAKFLSLYSTFDFEAQVQSIYGTVALSEDALAQHQKKCEENNFRPMRIMPFLVHQCSHWYGSPGQPTTAGPSTPGATPPLMTEDPGAAAFPTAPQRFPVRAMNVVDPLRPWSNLTRGVSRARCLRISAAFREGHRRLVAQLNGYLTAFAGGIAVPGRAEQQVVAEVFPATVEALRTEHHEPENPRLLESLYRCPSCCCPTPMCVDLEEMRQYSRTAFTPPHRVSRYSRYFPPGLEPDAPPPGTPPHPGYPHTPPTAPLHRGYEQYPPQGPPQGRGPPPPHQPGPPPPADPRWHEYTPDGEYRGEGRDPRYAASQGSVGSMPQDSESDARSQGSRSDLAAPPGREAHRQQALSEYYAQQAPPPPEPMQRASTMVYEDAPRDEPQPVQPAPHHGGRPGARAPPSPYEPGYMQPPPQGTVGGQPYPVHRPVTPEQPRQPHDPRGYPHHQHHQLPPQQMQQHHHHHHHHHRHQAQPHGGWQGQAAAGGYGEDYRPRGRGRGRGRGAPSLEASQRSDDNPMESSTRSAEWQRGRGRDGSFSTPGSPPLSAPQGQGQQGQGQGQGREGSEELSRSDSTSFAPPAPSYTRRRDSTPASPSAPPLDRPAAAQGPQGPPHGSSQGPAHGPGPRADHRGPPPAAYANPHDHYGPVHDWPPPQSQPYPPHPHHAVQHYHHHHHQPHHQPYPQHQHHQHQHHHHQHHHHQPQHYGRGQGRGQSGLPPPEVLGADGFSQRQVADEPPPYDPQRRGSGPPPYQGPGWDTHSQGAASHHSSDATHRSTGSDAYRGAGGAALRYAAAGVHSSGRGGAFTTHRGDEEPRRGRGRGSPGTASATAPATPPEIAAPVPVGATPRARGRGRGRGRGQPSSYVPPHKRD